MALWRSFLLVSDIDGSLITYDGYLPEVNLEAIERFKEKGGLFTLATGRSVQSARKYVEIIRPNAPVILVNGAMIYDYGSEKVLYKAVLPPGGVEIIKKVIEDFPDVGVGVHTDGKLLIVNEDELTDEYITHEPLNAFKVSIEELPEEMMKIIFMAREEKCDELQRYVEGLSLEGMQAIRSSFCYYEILPEGLNKGIALEKLAGMLGLDINNTAAVGDFHNDLGMIEKAGTGFAVDNAVDELKRAADYVLADCGEGAVAQAIGVLERLKFADNLVK